MAGCSCEGITAKACKDSTSSFTEPEWTEAASILRVYDCHHHQVPHGIRLPNVAHQFKCRPLRQTRTHPKPKENIGDGVSRAVVQGTALQHRHKLPDLAQPAGRTAPEIFLWICCPRITGFMISYQTTEYGSTQGKENEELPSYITIRARQDKFDKTLVSYGLYHWLAHS